MTVQGSQSESDITYLVGDDTKAICDFCNEGENRPPLSTIMVYGFIGYSPWLLAYISAPCAPPLPLALFYLHLNFQVWSFKVSRKIQFNRLNVDWILS